MIIKLDAPNTHWLGDILPRLRSQIVEADIDLAADLTLRVVGDADPARLGDSFQPGCDIDAVAKNIVVVDDDIAEMDPDPEFDACVRNHAGVLRSHAALDFHRAAHRIH